MIVEQIISKVMEKADAAQAVMTTQETSAVDFENDKLKSAESSQRTNINVKVIKDGKVGISSTTDPSDIEGVVNRALEAAEFGSKAHFELPGPGELNPVKIFDPELLPLQKPEMISMGQQMMDMIKAYNPEILAGAGVNRTITKIEFANSKGAVYAEEHTNFDVGAGGQWTRGTDILFAGHSSSVGITKCVSRSDLYEGLMEAARYDRRVLVERGISAREIEVSVLGNDVPVASIPGEIIPSREFYSYEAKYVDEASQLIIPAPISENLAEQVQRLAIEAYKAIDCAGMARVDFLLEKTSDGMGLNGNLYLNELNTIPGFTKISMYPKLRGKPVGFPTRIWLTG